MDSTSTTDGCTESRHSDISKTDISPALRGSDIGQSERGPSAPPIKDEFDYLYFIQFLTYRDIEIIPLADLVSHKTGMDMEQSLKIDPHAGEFDTIGAGASMHVVRIEWKSRAVAAKLPRMAHRNGNLRQYNDFMYDIFFEIQIMTHKSLCDHPNIVKLLGISFQETDWCADITRVYPILVVEAAHWQYPDLHRYVVAHRKRPPTPLRIAYELIGDMADGLTALHSHGVVHGDIKPDNILLFECEERQRLIAKIGDFGGSGVDISNDWPRGATEKWAPPEYCAYTKKLGDIPRDIYSFGLVCGYLVTNGLGHERSDSWRECIQQLYPTLEPDLSLDPLFKLLEDTTNEQPSRRLSSLSEVRRNLLGTEKYPPIST